MKKEIFSLPDSYKLAWEADFSKPLDTDFWHISDETRKGGFWSPDQVIVKDNQLIIKTEYKENGDKSGYYSGDIYWKHLRSTYGYYEIECKVDNIRGAWSAFWLMPDNSGMANKEQKAQDGCEIDIFENAIPHLLQTTLHYDDYTAQVMTTRYIKNFYQGFHTYGLDWKADGLKFYYDNKLLWHVKNPNHISHFPNRLEISTEVNGFNGKPNRFFWFGNGIITSKSNRGKLPYDYIVKHVRVYDNGQLKWSESNA